MTDTLYTKEFFDFHEKGSRESARETIPVLFELMRPSSVVDVGCGACAWLAEFKAAGVTDYLGIDGDYVDRARLSIEPDRFLARDLSQPFDLDRRFDLAVSLEVAEHLPESAAAGFVASLARLASVVLFSAAIPWQMGDGHLNMQWPEYWCHLFKRHDYVAVDCLRRRLWNVQAIKPWYRQNMLLFLEQARMADYPALAGAFAQAGTDPVLSMVHPAYYLQHHRAMQNELRAQQRLTMRQGLRLREISLAVFPDWKRANDELRGQLRAVLAAVASHPDRGRLSLVIRSGSQPVEAVKNLLRELAAELAPRLGAQLVQGPEVSGVSDEFDRDQWGILLECIQWRITFPGEDSQAIANAGAEGFPAVRLAEIETNQPLSRK